MRMCGGYPATRHSQHQLGGLSSDMLELCPSPAMRFAERIESVIASFSVSYIWGKFFAKLPQTAGEDGRVLR
jgi:hypothetical protein